MPSAAKRRKAAKKKDKKPSSSNTTSSVGNEDLKHESDGEHNNEQHFTEGLEEEVTEKREDVIPHVEENKSAGCVENQSDGAAKLVDKEGVVQIERELKLADDFDNKSGGSSSSNGSSSDDEACAIEKDMLVVGNAPVIDNVEAVNPLTEGPIQVSHTTPVSNIGNSVVEAAGDAGVEKVSLLPQSVPEGSDMVESEPKENGERKLCKSQESDRHKQVVKVADPEPKDEVTNAAEALGAMESMIHDGEDKSMQAYNELEHSSPSLTSETVESELKETGERELSSVQESARVTEVVKEMAPQQNNDKVPNDATTSGAKESAAHDSEVTPTQAYNAPRDDVVKDMEHANDSEVLGSSMGHAIGLRPVQTTSWKSCCGLFELFAGSNR